MWIRTMDGGMVNGYKLFSLRVSRLTRADLTGMQPGWFVLTGGSEIARRDTREDAERVVTDIFLRLSEVDSGDTITDYTEGERNEDGSH